MVGVRLIAAFDAEVVNTQQAEGSALCGVFLQPDCVGDWFVARCCQFIDKIVAR